MDRDWVVNELLRLEKRDQSVFNFWRQSIPEKPTALAAVQSNKPAAPTTKHLPPTAALPVDEDSQVPVEQYHNSRWQGL